MKNLRKIKVYALTFKYLVENSLIKRNEKNTINLLYYQIRNWGDAINPTFSSMLTTKKINKIDIDVKNLLHTYFSKKIKYLGIGSIIEHADRKTVIWGSGLQSPNCPKEVPLEICAVRGPLTASALSNSGIKCPNIYGDPALLFPYFYKPLEIKKKYKLGIVCHVVDSTNRAILRFKNNKEIKIISMRKTKLELIDEINECENIISTSLHGLVLGDAYKIPTAWAKASNKIAGKDFKFFDYHASIGFQIANPIMINNTTSEKNLTKGCVIRDIKIDMQKLFESCPYKTQSLTKII